MIWLAIGMQVVSSFLFASGAILQSLGVKSTFDPSGTASSNKLTFGGLIKLFKIPKWLLGLLFVFAGAAIHRVALSFAPVAVCSRWASSPCPGPCSWRRGSTSTS